MSGIAAFQRNKVSTSCDLTDFKNMQGVSKLIAVYKGLVAVQGALLNLWNVNTTENDLKSILFWRGYVHACNRRERKDYNIPAL